MLSVAVGYLLVQEKSCGLYEHFLVFPSMLHILIDNKPQEYDSSTIAPSCIETAKNRKEILGF